MTVNHNKRRVVNFCLAPFEKLELATDEVNIGLSSCDAPTVYIRGDVETTKLHVGSSLPIHGRTRYVVNPYAHTIKCTLIFGAPISLMAPQEQGHTSQFELSTVSFFTDRYKSESTETVQGRAYGMFILSKKSRYRLRLSTLQGNQALILPKAKIEYLNSVEQAFDPDISSRTNFFHNNGDENSDLVGYSGRYYLSDMDSWVTSIGYQRGLIRHNYASNYHTLSVTPETAVFVYTHNDAFSEINGSAIDLGFEF